MPELTLAAGGWLTPFISQLLAFILAALILWKFVVPVFKKVLGDRSQEIKGSFEKAEEETAAARRELEEIRKKLDDIENESKRRMDKAIEEAEKAREQSLGEARKRADAALEKARREIQIERDKAVLELREATTDLTLEAARHLLEKTVNEKVHGKLVDRYIEDLEKVRNR